MARPLAEKKNIDLAYQVGDGLEAVEQDQAKVQQILANLLSNAVKFTPGVVESMCGRGSRSQLSNPLRNSCWM